ncbi:MAG TPA: alternative ribosome rescue aminoacyl-tRNA hydrolase ArfB [Bacteroidales bacterium]|nr:alternative ribosome rescue aminoacyl-tRNA hydrolase ArfB [Bacteroidales bacterium]
MFTLKERHLEKECTFTASRSSGPGGQNVNKVNTKIDLRFNIALSTLLREEEKNLLLSKLKNRITDEDLLVISCQEFRSQSKNKKKTVEKLYLLLEDALKVPLNRKPTRLPEAFRKKRLWDKRHLTEKKNLRRPPTVK